MSGLAGLPLSEGNATYTVLGFRSSAATWGSAPTRGTIGERSARTGATVTGFVNLRPQSSERTTLTSLAGSAEVKPVRYAAYNAPSAATWRLAANVNTEPSLPLTGIRRGCEEGKHKSGERGSAQR